MFDILEAELPRRFSALDLGSGPGSITSRLLTRFPRANAVAVDLDPVVQTIGRGALRRFGERVRWLEADLGRAGWSRGLPSPRYDAALSTTALHWLSRRDLPRFYRELHRILRPGGIFLNGDYLPWEAADRGLRELAERVRKVRWRGTSRTSEWGPWQAWWKSVEAEPALRGALQIRKKRFPHGHPRTGPVSLETHERALRRAGFAEVAVVWEDFEDRLLFARRGPVVAARDRAS